MKQEITELKHKVKKKEGLENKWIKRRRAEKNNSICSVLKKKQQRKNKLYPN